MSFKVRILGCGSALPTTYRNASAQILQYNGHNMLIDCAEGTQILLRKYQVKFSNLNHIFISHLHGDHFYGLFGLLSSLSLMGRRGEVYIHCPENLRDMLTSPNSPLNLDEMDLNLVFVPLSPDGLSLTHSTRRMEVYSFPLKHRIDTWGFIFKEKERQPNIRKEVIAKYNLSIAEIVKVKDGMDLMLPDGSIVPNSELTIPPDPPASYAYVSDTLKLDSVVDYVKDCTVLYHEATYENALAKRAKETFHCTAGQAAEVALKANAQKLVLGHFSGRYRTPALLEQQAREVFPNTVAAKDGLEIVIVP
ncbi:MAG: ribonuclease Z [Bacteroidales bacterium]|nr:ribonuclease Z [Bacteroidales bacterium]